MRTYKFSMCTPVIGVFFLMIVFNSIGCSRGCSTSDNTLKEAPYGNQGEVVNTAVSPNNTGGEPYKVPNTKENLLGKWKLVSKDDNAELEDYEAVLLEITDANICISYYDGCKHVCPYTISGELITFSYPPGESETVCSAHAQPEGNKQEAMFNLIDKNTLSVFMDNIKFNFEREKVKASIEKK